MEAEARTDDGARGPPRCPACGLVLDLNLVEIKDEAEDDGELLLLLDCPRGDFHTTLTYRDVVTLVAAEVAKTLSR